MQLVIDSLVYLLSIRGYITNSHIHPALTPLGAAGLLTICLPPVYHRKKFRSSNIVPEIQVTVEYEKPAPVKLQHPTCGGELVCNTRR